MYVFDNPFFWAFVSMFFLVLGTALVSGIPLGHNPLFGFITVIGNDFARILMVLPFVDQPRFDFGAWNWILGGILIAAACGFGVAAFSVKWWKAPDKEVVLQTAGVYGIVRNPIYLADLLFSLGIAVGFGSIVGVALDPGLVDRIFVHRPNGGNQPGTGTRPGVSGIQKPGPRPDHPGAAGLIYPAIQMVFEPNLH